MMAVTTSKVKYGKKYRRNQPDAEGSTEKTAEPKTEPEAEPNAELRTTTCFSNTEKCRTPSPSPPPTSLPSSQLQESPWSKSPKRRGSAGGAGGAACGLDATNSPFGSPSRSPVFGSSPITSRVRSKRRFLPDDSEFGKKRLSFDSNFTRNGKRKSAVKSGVSDGLQPSAMPREKENFSVVPLSHETTIETEISNHLVAQPLTEPDNTGTEAEIPTFSASAEPLDSEARSPSKSGNNNKLRLPSRPPPMEVDAWSLLEEAVDAAPVAHATMRKKPVALVENLLADPPSEGIAEPNSGKNGAEGFEVQLRGSGGDCGASGHITAVFGSSASSASSSASAASAASAPVPITRKSPVSSVPSGLPRRTYGSVRSYRCETDDFGFETAEEFGAEPPEAANATDATDPADAADALLSITELRASGRRTRFAHEVGYVLDGLRGSAAERRSALIELASRCVAQEFVAELSGNNVAETVAEAVAEAVAESGAANGTDPVVAYCAGYFLMRIAESRAVAAEVWRGSQFRTVAVALLQNREEIGGAVRKWWAKSRPSKVAQRAFEEFLASVTEVAQQSYSCCYLGLRLLVAVAGRRGGVEIVAALLPEVCRVVAQVMQAEPQDLPSLEICQMGLTLVENCGDSSGALVAAAADVAQSVTQSWEFLFAPRRQKPNANAPQFETCRATFLRVCVIIATRFRPNSPKNSSEAQLAQCVYRIEAFQWLAEYIDCFGHSGGATEKTEAEAEAKSDATLPLNNTLFALGLLVLLVEADELRTEFFSREAACRPFFRMFDASGSGESGESDESGVAALRRHVAGYTAFVLGLLLTRQPLAEGVKPFVAQYTGLVRRAVEQFAGQVEEKWGNGVKRQLEEIGKELAER